MPYANIAYVKAPTQSDFPVCSDNWRCDGELSDCVTGKRKGRVYFTDRHTPAPPLITAAHRFLVLRILGDLGRSWEGLLP